LECPVSELFDDIHYWRPAYCRPQSFFEIRSFSA
jgi:hypothetical protein